MLIKNIPKNTNKFKKPAHDIFMENIEIKKNNKILKSALFLTIAGFVTKIIGVLYKVPLLEIVGSEGLGYYQLVFPVFVFALILSSGGITTTLSKIIAKCDSEKFKKLYFKICLIESVLFATIISIILFCFCDKIAYFQGGEGLCSSYKILCLALLSSAIISTFRGYFQGLNNMNFTAWSQLIEQVGKIALGLLFSFIFIKESVIKSIYGAFLGLSISEIICALFLIVLYVLKSDKIHKFRFNFYEVKEGLKSFNKELLPITITALITPLFGAINSLLVIDLLLKAGVGKECAILLFGLSGVILSLVGIPNIVSTALSTTIFPQICSKNKTQSEKNKIITFSFKLIFAVCIPCVFVFVIFSKPIVSFLYSEGLSYGNVNQLEIASHIIKIVSTMVLYSSLSSFTTTLLQAQNKSFKACQNLLFGSIITLICFIVLVSNPLINILGDSLSSLVGLSVTALLNLKELSKFNTYKLRFKDVFLSPILASLAMIFVMLIIFKGLSGALPLKLATLFVCFIGFVVYIMLMFMLKVFSVNDFSKLKPVKQQEN